MRAMTLMLVLAACGQPSDDSQVQTGEYAADSDSDTVEIDTDTSEETDEPVFDKLDEMLLNQQPLQADTMVFEAVEADTWELLTSGTLTVSCPEMEWIGTFDIASDSVAIPIDTLYGCSPVGWTIDLGDAENTASTQLWAQYVGIVPTLACEQVYNSGCPASWAMR